VQIAAHDVGRLSRAVAGCVGVAVFAFGASSVLAPANGYPPEVVWADPAAALMPAGLALFLLALPVPGPVGRITVYVLAGAAAAIGCAALGRHPAAGAASALSGLALACLDVRVRRPGGSARYRIADPLLAGATLIALVALVSRMFAPAFPDGGGPDGVMSPYLAGALLTLAVGAILARPDAGPPPTAAEAGRGTTVSSALPAPVAVQAIAELERSNTDLREANARLNAALAFKNDLTSMLTHDVAQPISSIASLAELLSTDWPDLPDDIRLELATKIDKNTRRLIKMMDDLQLLFRLDTGSVTARRTPVPLLEVAESAVDAVCPEVDVELEIDEDLAALADRGHLAAVVQNLLRNAVAYGDPPVEIRVERDADSVLLTVADRGPGIPEDLLPNLFGRFMRGAGLGLFIVRHLVEANGGSVRYERAEPRGARLVVTLEAAPV
jgi:signal transduction histidine kinase